MRKGKLILPTEGWKGLVTKYPKTHPQVPQDSLTEGSVNVRVSNRGSLSKREGGAEFTAASLPTGATAAQVQDMYEAIFTDGTRYLLTVSGGQLDYSSGGGNFQKVVSGYSPSANTEFASYRDRVYFCNGSDNPQVLDRTTTYGGIISLPATITITNSANLSTDSVTINGTTKTEGTHWTAATGGVPATDNNTTATSLAAALDAIAGVDASASGAVVTITSESPYLIKITDAGSAGMTLAAVTGPRVRTMGCQVPSSAPTSTGAVEGDGSVPEGTYYYRVTYLYYGAEESNGGAQSTAITVTSPNDTVPLVIPTGGYGVTARKIYRSEDQVVYTLVGTVDNNTATSYNDTASIGTTLIPSDNGEPRKFDYVVQFKDRLCCAGINGATADLDFSEVGSPNVYPAFNTLVCNPEDVITGIVLFNDRLVVFNKRSFGQILGTTADTFFYESFPGSVGCVDNRTIQIRTLRGVPVLVWLSDKGFYAFNGSSVEYISEAIEDLVNFNIQQVRFLDGANTQDTEAQFEGGTLSTGIDTNTSSGYITTKGYVPTDSTNPANTFDSAAEWAGGEGEHRVTLNSTYPNSLMTTTRRAYSYGEGTPDASLNVAGSNLKLDVVSDFSGETSANGYRRHTYSGTSIPTYSIASKFIVPRATTLSSYSIKFRQTNALDNTAGFSRSGYISVWQDSFGNPGTVLYSNAYSTSSPDGDITLSGSPSLSLPAGTYWIGVRDMIINVPLFGNTRMQTVCLPRGYASGSYTGKFESSVGTWSSFETEVSSGSAYPANYVSAQTAVTSEGEWISPSYDTGLLADTETMDVAVSGSWSAAGTGTSNAAIVVGQAATQDDLENEDGTYTSQTIAAFDGDDTVTFTATQRWFNLKATLTQSDDRYTPTLGPLTAKFNGDAIWISDPIDCSADVTAYNLTIGKTETGDATVTVTAAISDDDITYSAFADIATYAGAEKRYIKLKAVVTTTSDNSASARLNSLDFSWDLTATWESAAIDTGITPSALGIFKADYETNGGTVAFYMKEAPTESDLTAVTGGGADVYPYYAVTPGEFPETTNPAHTPLRWLQIKAVITAEKNKVPFIDSMTATWQRELGTSIRAASLFHDRAYYCAVAEAEQTTNNVMLVFDEYGNWTKYTGLTPTAISFFYAVPYYGTAAGTVIRFFDGTTDAGTNITMDVRTKAFDFTDITKKKVIRAVTVTGLNTGATYTPYYSIDEGVTWLPMKDSAGATSFTVGSDEDEFVRKLVPVWPNEINGKSIIVRLTEATAAEAEIHNIAIDAFVRSGETLNG